MIHVSTNWNQVTLLAEGIIGKTKWNTWHDFRRRYAHKVAADAAFSWSDSLRVSFVKTDAQPFGSLIYESCQNGLDWKTVQM